MNRSECIAYFGSLNRLAKALEITTSAVRQWGEQIPRARQYEIERITFGALRADPATDKHNSPPEPLGHDALKRGIDELERLLKYIGAIVDNLERRESEQGQITQKQA
jgi:hypothetical protein